MTIEEIDAEILRLRNMRFDLEKSKITSAQEAARENVGRCFTVDGIYVMVIDVPQVETDKQGRLHFNEYQYPAIYLSHSAGKPSNLIPFHVGTLFSGAWGKGNDFIHKYVEVSAEEFNTEFEKRLDTLGREVQGRRKQ